MNSPALLRPWLPLLGLILACGPPGSRSPLRLESSSSEGNTRVILIPDKGLQISARLPPALELTDGRVLRFTSPKLTADSAYFAEPPATWLSGHHRGIHGTLRASVCDVGAAICRSVKVEI
jgi:hypothetical protein